MPSTVTRLDASAEQLRRARKIVVLFIQQEAGGHLPSTGVHRLRVRDREVRSPRYLASALSGSWNERFHGSTAIQRASVKDLEVALVPMTKQRNIQFAANSTQLLFERSALLTEKAGNAKSSFLEAVRYDAHFANPAVSVRAADGAVNIEGAK